MSSKPANYNPAASYQYHRVLKRRLGYAEGWTRLVRVLRFLGRWLMFLFVVYDPADAKKGVAEKNYVHVNNALLLLLVAMLFNTIRRWKKNRWLDVAAIVFSLLALYPLWSNFGFSYLSITFTLYLFVDFVVIYWVRNAYQGEKVSRRSLLKHNYVPHSQRKNL